MSIPRKKLIKFDDDTLDRCEAAYQAEYVRWYWRRSTKSRGSEYEVVHVPGLVGAGGAETITFSKRECPDSDSAEAWLNTYRGRAAMRAALEAL